MFFIMCREKHVKESWNLKNFVDITKIEWDMVLLILKNTAANCEFPPLRKIPKFNP